MKDSLKKYIDNHREDFDTLEVPEKSFDNIIAKLDVAPITSQKKNKIFSLQNWALAASISLIFGIGSFYFWGNTETTTATIGSNKSIKSDVEKQINSVDTNVRALPITTDKEDIEKPSKVIAQNKPIKRATNIKVAKHETESEKTKAIVLIEHPYSASSRLKGIAMIRNLSTYDNQMIDLLSESATSDENTNVRLAAVEALSSNKNPKAYSQIQQIFLEQNDPMVQKELISILAAEQPHKLSPEVNKKLKELTENPTTADFVKDEAYAVLLKY